MFCVWMYKKEKEYIEEIIKEKGKNNAFQRHRRGRIGLIPPLNDSHNNANYCPLNDTFWSINCEKTAKLGRDISVLFNTNSACFVHHYCALDNQCALRQQW